MSNKKPKTLNENLERMIEQEIDQALLEEGLVDWVKEKFAAAGNVVKQGWEKISAAARQAIGGFRKEVASLLQQAKTAHVEAVKNYKEAAAAAGVNPATLGGMAEMQAFVADAQAFSNEMAQATNEVKTVVQNSRTAPAQQQQYQRTQTAQAPAQEAFVRDLNERTKLISEIREELELQNLLREADQLSLREQQERKLQEVGVFNLAGVALASPKLIMMLLGLLKWITGKFKSPTAQKLSKSFDKAKHLIHHKEEGFFDKVIPNGVAYSYYQKKMAFKIKTGVAGRTLKSTGGEVLSAEQFAANKKVRITTKMQMHKIFIMVFFIVGITHILHGIHSAFGALDAAATAAKGVEIGTEATSVVSELGSLTAAVGEGVGALAPEIADIASSAVDAATES